MRVLMTTDAVGGVWTFAASLVHALRRHGIDVTLAVMGPPPSAEQQANVATVPGLRIDYGPFGLEWMPDGDRDFAASAAWLHALARRDAPDVIHVNGYTHASLPFDCPTVCVAHSCVCTWWSAVKREPIPRRLDGYREAVRAGLRAASVVVAPTAAMRDGLAEAYDLNGDDVLVIANGTEVDACAGPREPFVFSAGRFWDEAKNLSALERAAAAIDWPVYIAGDEGAGGRAESPVQRLGRLSRPDVIAWLRRAAIYASPARYEPFGLSILEAARLGCALVLGDVPSLREVWGDAAVYVDPDDDRALAAAVNALIAAPARLASLAAGAQVRSAIYSAQRTGDAYAALYAGLTTGTRAGLSAHGAHA
jgi:glycosyltransferase involved in cell wall biosynthesis